MFLKCIQRVIMPCSTCCLGFTTNQKSQAGRVKGKWNWTLLCYLKEREYLKISLMNWKLNTMGKVDSSLSGFQFKWANYFADLRVQISKKAEDRLRPAAMANSKIPNYWPQEESAFLRLESLGVYFTNSLLIIYYSADTINLPFSVSK